MPSTHYFFFPIRYSLSFPSPIWFAGPRIAFSCRLHAPRVAIFPLPAVPRRVVVGAVGLTFFRKTPGEHECALFFTNLGRFLAAFFFRLFTAEFDRVTLCLSRSPLLDSLFQTQFFPSVFIARPKSFLFSLPPRKICTSIFLLSQNWECRCFPATPALPRQRPHAPPAASAHPQPSSPPPIPHAHSRAEFMRPMIAGGVFFHEPLRACGPS